MKLKYHIFIISILLVLNYSCQTEGCTDPSAVNFESKATSDDGSCIFNGQAIFWVDSTFEFNDITITIDAQEVGIIDGYFDTKPECGIPQGVNIELIEGTYEFTATDTTGGTYTDTLLIKKDKCNAKKVIIDSLI
jgi:hypothetical protein